MHLTRVAVLLLAPFALAAPTPLPNNAETVSRPSHALQERQSGGGSSIMSTLVSVGLPIAEKFITAAIPAIMSAISGAAKMKKRSDGSVVYEIQVPREALEAIKG